MIKVGENYFACDECPICDGWEHRIDLAEEFGDEPQFEYCYCEKIGHKFYAGGRCEDAVVKGSRSKSKGKRKTGYTYRHEMKAKKDNGIRKISTYGYCPNAGYPKYNYVNGEWIDAGYIQYPKNSNAQRYWKKHSNRIVRRSKYICGKGNQYRKHFEYWWTLY